MEFRKDYIQRMIDQAAAFIARILGARQTGHSAEASALIREAARSTLGMEYDTLVLADAASVADLLAHPLRIQVLARLVAEEAALLQQQREEARAASRWLLALELWLEARARGARQDAEETRMLESLCTHVEEDSLQERYRRLLGQSL